MPLKMTIKSYRKSPTKMKFDRTFFDFIHNTVSIRMHLWFAFSNCELFAGSYIRLNQIFCPAEMPDHFSVWWARLTVIRSENMSNVRPLFQVAYVHAHVYACSSLELLISTIMFNQQFLGKNYLNFRLIVITHDALD